MASRLVDAQAPGLARRVRTIADRAVGGAQWQSDMLDALARLQLLIDAYRVATARSEASLGGRLDLNPSLDRAEDYRTSGRAVIAVHA